jgi:hypothetical protein
MLILFGFNIVLMTTHFHNKFFKKRYYLEYSERERHYGKSLSQSTFNAPSVAISANLGPLNPLKYP